MAVGCQGAARWAAVMPFCPSRWAMLVAVLRSAAMTWVRCRSGYKGVSTLGDVADVVDPVLDVPVLAQQGRQQGGGRRRDDPAK
jgi:hypothetical protein